MTISKSRKAVIILGPPGAGKTSQAELLSLKEGFYHLETSRVIKHEISYHPKGDFVSIKGKKYFFKNEKKLFDSGFLCSPPFVVYLIKKKIKQVFSEGESIVFSGSPRTLFEAEETFPFLEKFYSLSNIKVIYIHLSAKQSVWRNSHRRVCVLVGHPILWNKETKDLKHCPLDGSELIKRSLDNSEVIKTRLEEFKKRTLPIVDYLKKKKIKFERIDGNRTVDKVFKDILKVIN